MCFYRLVVIFFFKQKTAYEMRISDWSSDVCSSDLINSSNVGTLRLAWSLSIPGGPLETAPLVHDGIMFVPTAGPRVQAIDAKTGEFIWDSRYRLPSGEWPSPLPTRGIRAFADLVFYRPTDAPIPE